MGFVTDFIGDLTGANQAAEAGQHAADVQAQMSQKGIDEQQRQFNKLVELMAPFVTAGTGALGSQQALLGLSGAPAQQAAISGLESSPQFQTLMQQGENAILQNASATGGLRGGNVQNALSRFRPQLLSQLIESQYSKLGGLSQLGQAAAGGQASAGINSASNIGNLLAQQGAAQAGGILSEGGARRQAFGDILKIGGTIAGAF